MPRKGPATPKERLSRIEGQVRGISRMVKEEEPSEKIIVQIQAAISSLEGVRLQIVKKQIRDEILKNLDESIDLLK